jgi:hypothetical protein
MVQIRRIEEAEKKVYTSVAEAQASKPANRNGWKCFQITAASGGMCWVWAPTPETALLWLLVGAEKRYAVLDVARIPTKTSVAGALAALSAEDREALIKEYSATPNKKR